MTNLLNVLIVIVILQPELQMAIHNLKYLGVSAQNSTKASKSSNKVSDSAKKMAKNKMANATMDLCRYV